MSFKIICDGCGEEIAHSGKVNKVIIKWSGDGPRVSPPDDEYEFCDLCIGHIRNAIEAYTP